ncbi:MAG: helix-turn-helix domain-containing protein [Chloroflexi bacterium]|nr:MAG: helix-turn-helix domain-containing protein [Chloroflexota bacterium]
MERRDVVASHHMLTVPEAARRTGRNPETIRRWIRSGRLRARKVGTQHVIEDADLDAVSREAAMLPLPRGMRKTFWGAPMPNVVEWIHRSRRSH